MSRRSSLPLFVHLHHLNCVLLDPDSGCASPLSIDSIAFGVGTWLTSRISTVQVRQTVLDRYTVTFETNSEDSLRELEEQNGMKDSVLLKAWWIKPTYRRALVLEFSFPTAILHRYVGLPSLPISPIPLCYIFVWPYYTDMLDCSFSFLTHPFTWPLSVI